MRLPSASKIELAVLCPAVTVLPWEEREAGEAAREGTAHHEYVADVLSMMDRDAALARVPEQWRARAYAIQPWFILDDLRCDHDRTLVEVAVAYDAEASTASVLGYRIDRDYPTVGESVAVGTVDIVGVASDESDCLVVADIKTGRHRVTDAARNWQLRLLALALCTVTGYGRARIAIVYIAQDGSHEIDAAMVDMFDLAADADALRELLQRGQDLDERGVAITDTVPGEQCRYCPAKVACPRYAVAGRALATTVPASALARFRSEIATDSGAASWWERARMMRELLDVIDEELKARAMSEPFALPDGSIVGPVTESGDRYIPDGDAVHARLVAAVGIEKADAVMPVVSKRSAGIGAVEKVLGKPAMRQLENEGLVRRKPETTRVGVTKPETKKGRSAA